MFLARTPLFASLTGLVADARRNLPEGQAPIPRAISRRAAITLMAAAAACSPEEPQRDPTDPAIVAIVGGGVSGLVTAWRLAIAGIPCEVFEASGRFGGRMYTLRDFTPEGQFCELGGEFIGESHTALVTLCRELGLPVQRLGVTGEPVGDIFDVRGVRLGEDLIDPIAGTGAFIPVAVRIAADQAALLDEAGNWTQRALDLDALPLSDYLDSLASSTERWVIDLLALAYHCEFGIPVDRQSSLNLVDVIGTDTALPFAPFGARAGLARITGGSSSLPEALVGRLMAAPLSDRVSLHLRHELSSLRREGDGVRLTFENEGKPPVIRTFRRVVMALPFTRLREVKGLGGLGLPADKMKVINEQGYGANAKLVVGTSSRPWTRTLPDLHAPMTGSLYSDRGFQRIWESSIGQPGEGGVLTNYLAGAPARSEEAIALATLQRGVAALSPDLAAALEPRIRASLFWPNHPHTRASYSGALAGQYTSFREIAARAELGGNLVFAGEHASLEWAGSMNGAVDAGEQAARELLAAARV
jgi:monoamine oxidase